ncbi:conserved hypothetical protein [Talaromyces stipitatus ATCC 10500]|uniref:Uncharacterized protein n=1 Tax=Talaromyces stipitatus (strain ATCC 10500 / CBS 375.48 / QM 6759 / NRRL 1006) TaxID=441959 RepID=B8MIP4_TALSN|nr:uncharacterized protein TSTA_045920 [Talaromyces stipitatus ATCC 10500]EED15136.1 conserved hypothetical protein [Talaromyces stipitatus ATCC 10500]
MNGRMIPGFYFDTEKKKYYRIQANHVAPAGSQYSREAVKKRKLDNQQRHRQDAIDRRVRRERVKTSRCRDYAATGLSYEVGSTPLPAFVRKSHYGRAYVSQLQRQCICNLSYMNVVDFVRHGPSGALVAGACMPGFTKMTLCPLLSESTSADTWAYDADKNVSNSLVNYESFVDNEYSYHQCRCAIPGFFCKTPHNMDCEHSFTNMHHRGTHYGGGMADAVARIWLLPDLNSQSWKDRWQCMPVAATSLYDITLWCSAARPHDPSEPIFAVGTSDGLQTTRVNATGGMNTYTVLERQSKDILAVEWLSQTIIASGFRDSLLFLSDLRSNDSVQRIKHPGMIGQIKKVDDYRLVVAGNRSVKFIPLP